MTAQGAQHDDNDEVFKILIGIEGLDFENYSTSDPQITMEQILQFAGVRQPSKYDVYAFANDGKLYRMSNQDTLDISEAGVERIVVFKTDRANRIIIDGERYDWGGKFISGYEIRQISNSPENLELWMQLQNKPDERLNASDIVNVQKSGIENFYFKQKTWLLKIRRDTFSFEQPCVLAKHALEMAGFDLSQKWDLVLSTASGRREIDIMDKIDLSEEGIEKLRVKPRLINNGESNAEIVCGFSLLDRDEAFLRRHFKSWRTVEDGSKRWLIIDRYSLPNGFNHQEISLALDVPRNYPAEQIDMFYCYPCLVKADGQSIPLAHVKQDICGKSYQRWSRHRPHPNDWDCNIDCIETHLDLVDESIAREIGK